MRFRQLLPIGALAAAWPFVEPHLPVLRTLRVPVLEPGASPIRVLHLSDLHLLARHERRAAWVLRLRRLQPDLIVSTGDHWSCADAGPLLVSTLGGLTGHGTPAVFVPGNNDYFTPALPSLARYVRGEDGPVRRRRPDLPWSSVAAELTQVGWTDLTQRRVTLQITGRPVTLTGTDDAHLRRDRYAQVGGPVDGLGLGITHTPAGRLLRRFAADGHALVLAGHTHGGQLRVPGLGALVTNCDLERRRARGLSRPASGGSLDSPGWLHVSAGLGTSPYAPVRLCCRPEATLLELVPGTGVR